MHASRHSHNKLCSKPAPLRAQIGFFRYGVHPADLDPYAVLGATHLEHLAANAARPAGEVQILDRPRGKLLAE